MLLFHFNTKQNGVYSWDAKANGMPSCSDCFWMFCPPSLDSWLDLAAEQEVKWPFELQHLSEYCPMKGNPLRVMVKVLLIEKWEVFMGIDELTLHLYSSSDTVKGIFFFGLTGGDLSTLHQVRH